MSGSIPSLMGQSSPVSGVVSPGMSMGSALMGQMTAPRTLGALQAGTSVLSGLGTMASYNARASSDEIQAGEWGTQSKDEFVMGTNQVGGLKSQYLNDIGGVTSRAAAGGVDVGQGVAAGARTAIGQSAVSTGQVDTLASDIRARRDNINQIQAQAAADEAKNAGTMALLGGIFDGGLKILSAGVI